MSTDVISVDPNLPGAHASLTGSYGVKAMPVWKTGEVGEAGAASPTQRKIAGYVAFIVLTSNSNKKRKMADFIIRAAALRWGEDIVHETPELAMAHYNSVPPLLENDPMRNLPEGRWLHDFPPPEIEAVE